MDSDASRRYPDATLGVDVTSDRDLWLAIRQALLMVVDAIERRYAEKFRSRTSELRKEKRQP